MLVVNNPESKRVKFYFCRLFINNQQTKKPSKHKKGNVSQKSSKSSIFHTLVRGLPIIKIELAVEKETDVEEKFNSTKMVDLLMTEALLNIHTLDLFELQNAIDDFKSRCNEFRRVIQLI